MSHIIRYGDINSSRSPIHSTLMQSHIFIRLLQFLSRLNHMHGLSANVKPICHVSLVFFCDPLRKCPMQHFHITAFSKQYAQLRAIDEKALNHIKCLLGLAFVVICISVGKTSEYFTIMIKIKSKSNYVSVCKIRVDIDATGGWLTFFPIVRTHTHTLPLSVSPPFALVMSSLHFT